MRKIKQFSERGGKLVTIIDSITGDRSSSAWSGASQRFWVRAQYAYATGPEGFTPKAPCPGLNNPIEVYLLDDCDVNPLPEKGWCYAHGFFGY